MNTQKRMKLGLVSLSAVALLAACSNGGSGGSEGTTPLEPENTEEVESNVAGDDAAQEESSESAADNVENADDTSNEEAANDSTNQGNNQEDSPGIENIDFPITVEDAVSTFNNAFGSPNIDTIEFDRDDGRYVYDFDGWDDQAEYEMTIDAQTGEILSQDTDDDDDADEDDRLELDGIISPQEAMGIALEESSGNYVEEWDLDTDFGETVYEIDIEGDNDIDVDAQTGEIR